VIAVGTLIVDGHNVLRSAPRYAEVVERDIDAARERLIADLGARAADGTDVVLVFDGAGNPDSDGTPAMVGGVTVIFSPSGVEADAVIENLAREARLAGVDTEVVTSDSETRWASLGGSVTVRRASAFALEIAGDESDWRAGAAGAGPHAPLEDRLDAETRARLERLSRRRR
jgi:predicted RNA-binding protein with PIN domain